MTPVRVEHAHLAAIAQLEREAFVHPWSEEALALLCTDAAFAYVILDGERAVSYGGMMCVAGEGQITNIATAPDCRNQGLGADIMAALLGKAREMGLSPVSLEVRESNAPAIALYEKFGFTVAGKRPRFYTNPTETALVMLCPLGE
jgi:ribosomal-protein-alanine acetyltransferase